MISTYEPLVIQRHLRDGAWKVNFESETEEKPFVFEMVLV